MRSTRAPRRPAAPRSWAAPLRALGLPALAGLLVWLATAGVSSLSGALDLSTIDLLLLFAQLVLVPLGMPLLRVRIGVAHSLVLLAWYVYRFAALGVVLSVVLPIGALSAALAAPWLVFGGLIGMAGAVSFAGSRSRGLPEVGRLAASLYVAGAGLVYVMYRAGVELGFAPVIVELTAVHYTATGYAALLLAAAVLSAASGRARAVAAGGLASLLTGLVMTPVGFIVSPVLQVAGAVLVGAGLAAVMGATAWLVARGLVARAAGPWLAVSAGSGMGVASLAVTYAITEAAGTAWPPIPVMAATHGVLAAIGLLGCGLLGWRLAQASP